VSFSKLKTEIIDKDLCVRCGTCIGVCPHNSLTYSDANSITLSGKCSDCGICLDSCPGKEVNFNELSMHAFAVKGSKNPLGHFTSSYICCSSNVSIRDFGSSGGVVTSLLCDLLEREEISGAIVSAFSDEKPYKPMGKIATTVNEIKEATGSKYILYPHNEILSKIRNFSDGSLAFVGLPCHIQALRKIQQSNPKLTAPVKYMISLYCGLNLMPEMINGLMTRFGIDSLDSISRIQFREGTWPGKISVELKDRHKYEMSKFSFNYMNFLYTPERCLSCIDLAGELSDISVGDGWLREAKRTTPGWSVVLGRSESGSELIRSAIGRGVLQSTPISEDEAVDMHRHVINNKKTGAFIRISNRKKANIAIPNYYIAVEKSSYRRRFLEFINHVVLYFGKNETVRYAFHKIPLCLLENIMARLRRSLKRIS